MFCHICHLANVGTVQGNARQNMRYYIPKNNERSEGHHKIVVASSNMLQEM